MRKDSQGNGQIVRLDIHGYDVISLLCGVDILIEQNRDNLMEFQRGSRSQQCLIDMQKNHIEELKKLKKYLEDRIKEKVQLTY